MGHHNSNDQSAALFASAQAQAANAAKPDPLEELQRQHAQQLDDWEYSKNAPIDVRNMPGSNVGIGLFNDAKTAHDANRKGKGLAFAENQNSNYATALDKENQITRDVNASGDLENYVSDKLAAKDQMMSGLAAMGNARNSSSADRAMSMWNAYINRPQKPSFLKQFALGALGAAGQIGAGFATGGASTAASAASGGFPHW